MSSWQDDCKQISEFKSIKVAKVFFGEMPLIENTIRTTGVTAAGYCVVYRLSKSRFIELTDRHADLRLAVDDMVKTRQLEQKKPLVPMKQTLLITFRIS